MGGNFQQSSSSHQRRGHAHQQEPAGDNSIDISNHSVSLTVSEPTDSFVLRGHNCKIEIGRGNTISHLIITGHNNKVFSKSSGSQCAVIDKIEVLGHNNRVEHIISNSLKVSGHNNRLTGLHFVSMQDTGICN